MEPFEVFDCSLAREATGRSCSNLRDLLDAVRTVPDSVIEHHMMRCALDDVFELNEFPNDFARWCFEALGDQALGERLSLIDPYQHETPADVRIDLIRVVEDRLWDVERIPWCRPEHRLHLMSSRLVAYDTGDRIPTRAALIEALPRLSLRSLFFHVHEARRRTGGRTDDLSAWLEKDKQNGGLVERIRAIDFYFLNLGQLREQLVRVVGQAPSTRSS
jgi:hypothetical protein